MKKLLVVSVSFLAAAGVLIMQTTPVQASPLISVVGNPLPKLGGGEQQWWADAGKTAVANGVAGAVTGAVSTAVIGTPSAIVGGAIGGGLGLLAGGVTYAVQTGLDSASSSSSDTSATTSDEAVTDANDNGTSEGTTDSCQTGQDSSGGIVVRSGATASPIYDHFGVAQYPGGTTVSQPGLGGLTPGKLATVGASRLD